MKYQINIIRGFNNITDMHHLSPMGSLKELAITAAKILVACEIFSLRIF